MEIKIQPAMIQIYSLFHPITDRCFYVGVTGVDLQKRLNGHMSSTDTNKEKVAVIEEMLLNGNRPVICLIEQVESADKASEKEIEWISHYKSLGHPITNKSLCKSGRRATTNPKVTISLHVPVSDIEKFGGIETFKDKMYQYLEQYPNPSN